MARSSAAPSFSPLHLMIAEDDEEDRMLLWEAMQEAGFTHQPHFFEDGEAMVAHVLEGEKALARPDLIILDLSMPRKGGMEVLEVLREAAAWREVPVVILTGYHDMQDQRTCLGLGARKFLFKPDSYEELVSMMAALRWEVREEE